MAVLRAAEEMARLQSQNDLAQRYRERFELGSRKYDELCWNGEYYIQIVDMEQYPEQQFATGCHIDQLLGQWWAHALDLGYVLPKEHIKTAVQNMFKFNRREGFNKAEQRPRIYMDERDKGDSTFVPGLTVINRKSRPCTATRSGAVWNTRWPACCFLKARLSQP